MINIEKKDTCCGCTACSIVCPKNCIEMVKDKDGFYYPKVDESLCINCGQCEKKCPVRNTPIKNESKLMSYVARDRNVDVVRNSTSGGIFTSIMNYIFSLDGVVYGSIFDSNSRIVKHIRVTKNDKELISKIPGSKYVASDIIGIFDKIREDIKNNRYVVFCGTPCQVAALRNIFGENKYLFLVDFVCRGNPSPKVLDKFLDELTLKYKSNVSNVIFRYKLFGYHHHVMKVSFENGKNYFGSIRVNPYLKSFFKDLSPKPSCYNCQFKGIKHASDITLFDSWHASNISNVIDDNRGYTNIVVQTQKGSDLFSNIKDQLLYEPSLLDKAIELDGIMIRQSIIENPRRKEFFLNLDNEKFSKHCKKYFSISIKDKIIEKSKYVIFKFKS